ncbi:uncharacterized protein LOC123711374 isoform X1 [Pieris brassicae]|uniref:uncharacterized protein LOC123711374 isoform X1 n=2 Tax=Pieris brassicae TaxID=7116 RepID=UPI001E65FCE6|nr:uncharacterized protein LOC123711374 isoform X1 [Pieris brassicae]
MWFNIIIYCMLWIRLITSIWCHLPEHASTPSNKIDQFCSLADTCIHDTIPICGRMGEETRTFLDLCDLLEFACDTNQVYAHVDDMEGCPVFKF